MSTSTNTVSSGLSWAAIAAKPKSAPKPTLNLPAPPVEYDITPSKSKRTSVAPKPRNKPIPKAKGKSAPIPPAKVYTEAEVKKVLSTPASFDWADEVDEFGPAIPIPAPKPTRRLDALAPNRGTPMGRWPTTPRETQGEEVAIPRFVIDRTPQAPRAPLDTDTPRANPLILRTWRRGGNVPTFGNAEPQVAETPIVPAFMRPTECEDENDDQHHDTESEECDEQLIAASPVVPEVSFQETGSSSQELTGLTHLPSIPMFTVPEEESPELEAPLDEATPIKPVVPEALTPTTVKTPPPSEAQPLSLETGRGTEESQTVAVTTPPAPVVPSEVFPPPPPPRTPSMVISPPTSRPRAEAPTFIPCGAQYIPSPAVACSEWGTYRSHDEQRQEREPLRAFLQQYNLIRDGESRNSRQALLVYSPVWGYEEYY
ncbi:hypothetical protein IFR05_006153 [Cadophora sp. M221]|nr:hypothetical protein IFR05_006153 [Cadophora sp. M221]